MLSSEHIISCQTQWSLWGFLSFLFNVWWCYSRMKQHHYSLQSTINLWFMFINCRYSCNLSKLNILMDQQWHWQWHSNHQQIPPVWFAYSSLDNIRNPTSVCDRVEWRGWRVCRALLNPATCGSLIKAQWGWRFRDSLLWRLSCKSGKIVGYISAQWTTNCAHRGTQMMTNALWQTEKRMFVNASRKNITQHVRKCIFTSPY